MYWSPPGYAYHSISEAISCFWSWIWFQIVCGLISYTALQLHIGKRVGVPYGSVLRPAVGWVGLATANRQLCYAGRGHFESRFASQTFTSPHIPRYVPRTRPKPSDFTHGHEHYGTTLRPPHQRLLKKHGKVQSSLAYFKPRFLCKRTIQKVEAIYVV
jgi:hypothetical protein